MHMPNNDWVWHPSIFVAHMQPSTPPPHTTPSTIVLSLSPAHLSHLKLAHLDELRAELGACCCAHHAQFEKQWRSATGYSYSRTSRYQIVPHKQPFSII
jgi:hypothetical protein